jgi:hypothetical protein
MDTTIPCVCPPKADGTPRHETDSITFRDRLDFRSGLAIRQQLALEKQDDTDMSAGEILAMLTESYLVFGIESWTVEGPIKDDKGRERIARLPATRPNIRAFLQGHPEEAMQAGDAADEQYQEQVLLPLLRRASTSSEPLPTPEPTSPKQESSGHKSTTRKPRQSRPSLISTTPTDGIGSITSPHDGGSKSSPNWATDA